MLHYQPCNQFGIVVVFSTSKQISSPRYNYHDSLQAHLIEGIVHLFQLT